MLHMAETMQAKFGKQVGRSMTGDAGFKTAIYSIADSRRMPSKRYPCWDMFFLAINVPCYALSSAHISWHISESADKSISCAGRAPCWGRPR